MPIYSAWSLIKKEWVTVFSENDLGKCLNSGLKFNLALMDGDLVSEIYNIVRDLREAGGDAPSPCGPLPPNFPAQSSCCKHTSLSLSCEWLASSCEAANWFSCKPTPPPHPPTPAPPTPPTPAPCNAPTRSSCQKCQTTTCGNSNSLTTYNYVEHLFSPASASGGPVPSPAPGPGPGPGPDPYEQCRWDNTASKCCDESEFKDGKCESIKAIWGIPTRVGQKPTNSFCLGTSDGINTFINFGQGGQSPPDQTIPYVGNMKKNNPQIKNIWMNFGGSAAGFSSQLFNQIISFKDQLIKYGYNGICLDWERGDLTLIKPALNNLISQYNTAGFKIILVVSGLGICSDCTPGNVQPQDLTGVQFDYVMLMLYRTGVDSQGGVSSQGNYADNCIQCCTSKLPCDLDDCKSGCKGNNVKYYIDSWKKGTIWNGFGTSGKSGQGGNTITIDNISYSKIIPCWAFGTDNQFSGDPIKIQQSVSDLVSNNIAFYGWYDHDLTTSPNHFPPFKEMLGNFKFVSNI